MNNLIATREFNALLASFLGYYLSEKPELSVNFVRDNDILSSLGLLNFDEKTAFIKSATTSFTN